MPHPDLARTHDEFETLKADARALIAPVSPAAFNWQPGPKRWSIGECFDHLNVVGETYLKTLRRGIDRARADNVVAPGPYSHTLVGRLFLWGMEPPPRFRVGAPPAVIPAPGSHHDRDAVLARFLALQETFQQALASADGLDLGRVEVSSPPSRYFKISLLQGFQAMAGHERRHVWQARQVQSSRGFPGN